MKKKTLIIGSVILALIAFAIYYVATHARITMKDTTTIIAKVSDEEMSKINLVEVTPSLLKTEVAKHKGNTIVLFWATWCKPCKREMEAISKLEQKYNIELLPVCCDMYNTRQDTVIRKVMAAHNLNMGYRIESNFSLDVSNQKQTSSFLKEFEKVDNPAFPYTIMYKNGIKQVQFFGMEEDSLRRYSFLDSLCAHYF